MADVTLVLGIVGALVALGLCFAVLATAPSQRLNQLLALELANEAIAAGGEVISELVGRPYGIPIIYVTRFAIGTFPFVYLLLLSVLSTPLVDWLRLPRVRLGIGALAIVFGAVLALSLPLPGHLRADGQELQSWADSLRTGQFFLILLVLLFALVAAFDANRRAEQGSVQRKRARAFLVSFSIRDAFAAAGLALMVAGALSGEATTGTDAGIVVATGDNLTRLGTIIATPLLAYGILRTQLFNIDLRIRLGLQAGTVAAVFVIGIFVAFKLTEFYLTGAMGYGAGALTAGLLLFITPRLNAFVEQIAKRVAPTSAPSTEYLAFRKFEVYKAAVESALETGPLDARAHEMLERLRIKLGLLPTDAAAIQADIT